jgi:hypothetical protein
MVRAWTLLLPIIKVSSSKGEWLGEEYRLSESIWGNQSCLPATEESISEAQQLGEYRLSEWTNEVYFSQSSKFVLQGQSDWEIKG